MEEKSSKLNLVPSVQIRGSYILTAQNVYIIMGLSKYKDDKLKRDAEASCPYETTVVQHEGLLG